MSPPCFLFTHLILEYVFIDSFFILFQNYILENVFIYGNKKPPSLYRRWFTNYD